MMRVCVVCLGNICRSPMAEAVLQRRITDAGLADQVEVESAGTGGWHRGDPPDQRATAALARRGYTQTSRAQQFRAGDHERFDVVLALDGDNLDTLRSLAAGASRDVRLLRSFDPTAPTGAEVPDPYYGGAADFDHALDLIEAAADGVVTYLRERLE